MTFAKICNQKLSIINRQSCF